MTSAKDYEKRVNDILGTNMRNGKLHLHWESVEEAKLRKAEVAQMQKEIRLVKKQLSAHMREINSAYTSERTKVGKGFGAAFLGGLFGKKSVGKVNASQRDSLRLQQLEARRPYESMGRMIDSVLLQLDQAKLQIDSWMVDSAKSS